jgi:hypothetical protein
MHGMMDPYRDYFPLCTKANGSLLSMQGESKVSSLMPIPASNPTKKQETIAVT